MRAPIWAVLPAAGTGSRMGTELPKQYLEVAGRTILEHAIARLCADARVAGLVVCLREGDSTGANLLQRVAATLDRPLLSAVGGAQRQATVSAGVNRLLAEAGGDALALVHDAARPCLHPTDLQRLLAAAELDDGALLATPVAETLKRADESPAGPRVGATVDRAGLWRAQTPQLFRCGLLADALRQAQAAGVQVTDEAQAVERLGFAPHLVEGRADNIKVTRAADLDVVAALLRPDSEWSRSAAQVTSRDSGD